MTCPHPPDLSIGYDPGTGSPKEVFGSSPMVGSQTATLVSDACIIISLAMQAGLTPAQIAHSLSKEPVWDADGEQPASLIGAIAAILEWVPASTTEGDSI